MSPGIRGAGRRAGPGSDTTAPSEHEAEFVLEVQMILLGSLTEWGVDQWSSPLLTAAARPPMMRTLNSLSTDLTPDRCEVECLHPEHVGPLIGRVIGREDADRVATFALLADATRARILHALSLTEELCVCDLALLLGMSESAVSHQLRLLRINRTVDRRKVGRVVYYRLADEHVRHMFADGLRHAREEDRRTASMAG